MAKRKRRKFTAEYKAEVVRLVGASGKGVGQVAKELDLTETSVRNWVRQGRIDAQRDPAGPLTSEERAELTRLRREFKTVTQERDFLKNYLGRAPPPVGREARVRYHGSGFGKSGRQLFGDVIPVKKHGPGRVAYLAVVTPLGDPD